MKVVFSANDLYKVNIMQEMLTEANIESFVMDQKGSDLLIGEVYLYVNENDEAKSLEIVKKHDL